MNILETIIAKKQEEIAFKKKKDYLSTLNKAAFPSRSLKEALLKSPTGIIAEFKRKSPSKGWIHPNADAAIIPVGYENGGATALSVLTDEYFFGGSHQDLLTARENTRIPILRKDFIIDSYQLKVAQGLGANAILLIAAALDKSACEELALEAKEMGLEILLEIHEEAEIEYITPTIDMVGINNRNLKTFVTDIETSFKLGAMLPENIVKISESGISSVQTIRSLRSVGFKGFLIGETFMSDDNPAAALSNFIGALN